MADRPPEEDGRLRVLVVDDEDDVRLGLDMLARQEGAETRAAATAEEALEIVHAWPPHLVLSDVTMPGRSGMDLLEELRQGHPHVRVVLITGFGTIELAVAAMRAGASHFITKPFDNEEVKETIRALGQQALLGARVRSQRAREVTSGERVLVAQDPRMRAVLERVDQVAPTAMPVLIQGRSGVGKELVARSIHARSAVRERDFLAVNAGALPDALLASELFGHVKGAFTGAVRDRQGIFEQAAGGTVFLDEVGLMSLSFQSQLLRVLQEKTVVPLGTSKEIPVDFRLVTATAQELQPRIESGAFREDLYYRLNVVTIEVPALRDRPADIVPLATHFMAKYADHVPALGGRPLELTTEAVRALERHPWPGNVRELENAIQRALVVSGGAAIRPEHLGLDAEEPAEEDAGPVPYERAKQRAVERFQRRYVERALARAGGNVTRAAELCDMTRAALQRIMRSLDIDRERFTGA